MSLSKNGKLLLVHVTIFNSNFLKIVFHESIYLFLFITYMYYIEHKLNFYFHKY